MTIVHSIIAWDCSFRGFFHLIDALRDQDYDSKRFELIYVEQRNRAHADAVSHDGGRRSLADCIDAVGPTRMFRVVYLDDPDEIPYHVGRLSNAGLELARGEFISVMDGDLLVPPDFLARLEAYHRAEDPGVVNLFRHMCSEPVGVPRARWEEQVVDLKRCLEVCLTRDDPTPTTTTNKGPLISASRKLWSAVGGYDTHPIWSTGVTRLGQDVTARLEMVTGAPSMVLPDSYAVHPWHPMGFHRDDREPRRLLDAQQQLVEWSLERCEPQWGARTPYTEQVHAGDALRVDVLLYGSLARPGQVEIHHKRVRGRVVDMARRAKRRLRGITARSDGGG